MIVNECQLSVSVREFVCLWVWDFKSAESQFKIYFGSDNDVYMEANVERKFGLSDSGFWAKITKVGY